MTKGKILVVDDDRDIVKALGVRFLHAGYDVVSASDGCNGTRLALRENPDLVILDIGIPCGDGHTVLKRIRDNFETLFLPVIVLTAKGTQFEKSQARHEGASGFMVKPYRFEELLAMVESLLAVNS